MVRNSDSHLNYEPDITGHLKTGPFNNPTTLDHSNTGLVHNSDHNWTMVCVQNRVMLKGNFFISEKKHSL